MNNTKVGVSIFPGFERFENRCVTFFQPLLVNSHKKGVVQKWPQKNDVFETHFLAVFQKPVQNIRQNPRFFEHQKSGFWNMTQKHLFFGHFFDPFFDPFLPHIPLYDHIWSYYLNITPYPPLPIPIISPILPLYQWPKITLQKRGEKWPIFWPIFDPFLTHFWTTFWPLFTPFPCT